MSAAKEPCLGCEASELEVGTEFSLNEGATWLVVQTEPQYVFFDNDETDDLHFMASPSGSTDPADWQRVQVNDRRHVLLQREWTSAPASERALNSEEAPGRLQ